MNIVLGTTSPQKLNILQQALQGKLSYWNIEGIEVSSGISEQPLSIEETTQGAINRAKAALQRKPKASLAIGMEGGLEDIGGIFNLVCVVAFWDGEKLTIGESGHLPLPHSVSNKIKQGGEFGQLIREYQKTAPPEEEERIKQLISRELSFTSAINHALPKLNIGKINALAAWATPQLHANQSTPKLLRLSSILSGFYFATSPIILMYSMAWSRMEVYVAYNWLITLSLLLTLLGSYQILRLPTTRKNKELYRSLLLVIASVILLLIINLLLLGSIGSILSDISLVRAIGQIWTPVIYATGLLVFGLLGFALRQLGIYSIISMATTAYLLIGTIGIIENYWVLANGGGSPFMIPFVLIGLLWSIGIWHLARELDEHYNPRGVNVSAFHKVDKY